MIPFNTSKQLHSALVPLFGLLAEKNLRYIRYQMHCTATALELSEVEAECEMRFPRSMSMLFTNISSRVEFSWALKSPASVFECRDFWAGCIAWDLLSMDTLIREKRQLERGTVFEDVWIDKIPFVSIGDGSFLATSSNYECPNRVYYLRPGEHDDASVLIGKSIEQFLAEWCGVAGVTTEAMLQFIEQKDYGISATSPAGKMWREWISST